MKTYVGGRCSGKTYRLFEQARNLKQPVITFRESKFRNLVNYAHNLGFDDIEIRYVDLEHAINNYEFNKEAGVPYCDCLMDDINEELPYLVTQLTGYNIKIGVVGVGDGQLNFGLHKIQLNSMYGLSVNPDAFYVDSDSIKVRSDKDGKYKQCTDNSKAD